MFYDVKSHIRDLLLKIYCELPCPPGVVRKQDKRTYFERFVRDDFPACEREFESWAVKFGKFRRAVINLYSRLHLKFGMMEEARKKEIEQTLGVLDRYKGFTEIDRFAGGLKTYIENLNTSSDYYHTFFLSLNSLGNKVKEIRQNMKYYRNYQTNSPSVLSWSTLFMILAAVFGIILPLVKLCRIRVEERLAFIYVPLPLILLLGFFLFTTLSVCFFLKSLSAITL